MSSGSTEDRSSPDLRDVSVIVATRNEGKFLEECLSSLETACRGEAEIIVVDDQSTDLSATILEKHASRIRVLQGEGKGPGRARNLALQSSGREWVAFTDGDCTVEEGWLAELCSGIGDRQEGHSSIGGRQEVHPQASRFERTVGDFLKSVGFISDYLHKENEVREVFHNPTCNVMYAKKVLDRVRGFDESLWPCEDLDLDIRLSRKGYRALFDPAAVVYHRRPTELGGFVRMMGRYGFGHAQLVRKHGFCQVMHLLPLLFPFVFVGWISFLWVFPWLFVILPILAFLTSMGIFVAKGKTGSTSLQYAGLLWLSVGSWLLGFVQGMLGQMRIAGK